ncbi:unnamed protein product, partial [Rotaria sp. Silwood1]
MGLFNQNTTQTETYESSAKQPESTSRAVGDIKQHIHGDHGHKRYKKYSRTPASISSRSSYSNKHHSADSNFHTRGRTAARTGNYIYGEQHHYSARNGGAHDRYGNSGGYDEFYYGNEAVVDESSDIYRRRRQGSYRHQTIRLPDQPSVVRQVRHRLATPEPDTLERVYVRRQLNDVIEEIIEQPTTPPPRLQERTIIEPSSPPQTIRKVIRVPPRSKIHEYQQQETLNSYGSLSGANVPAAGYGVYGAGYGQSGQGYNTSNNYYQLNNNSGIQQQGPLIYGQTGLQRYQEPQQIAAGAHFNYNVTNTHGLASAGMYPPQPVAPPSNILPNAFGFETGGIGASAPSLPQPSLSSYGPSPQGFGGLVGAASFGGQGFKSLGVPSNFGLAPNLGVASGLGVAPCLGAVPNFFAGGSFGAAPTFGGTSAGGIGEFFNSGFGGGAIGYGGGFGGGQLTNPGSYGAGTSFGGAPFGTQGLIDCGALINLLAGAFSSIAMSCCGGGMGASLGGYGGAMPGGFGGYGGAMSGGYGGAIPGGFGGYSGGLGGYSGGLGGYSGGLGGYSGGIGGGCGLASANLFAGG